MANDFVQYKDEDPILRDVTPNDRSKGQEATAKAFGAASELAFKTGETLEKTESATMLTKSVGDAERIKTQSQLMIDAQPAHAKDILERTHEQLDLIEHESYVNASDRKQLNSHLSSMKNEIALKAGTTQIKVNRQMVANQYWETKPEQLNIYKKLLMSDPKAAEKWRESQIETIKGLGITGNISQKQVESELGALSKIGKLTHNYMRHFESGDATARDYQTLNSNPLDRQVGGSIAGTPIDGDTKYLSDDYNQDMSFEAQQSKLRQGKHVDFEAYSNLKEHQQNSLDFQADGTASAEGAIKAGVPYPQIMERYNYLEHNSRSPTQEGEYWAYKRYDDALKAGNFADIYNASPDGQEAINQYNIKSQSLDNYAETAEYKAAKQNEYDNWMAQQQVIWGRARHIPDEYVKPVSARDVGIVQNGFNLNGSVDDALAGIKKYSNVLKSYVANEMKSPDQRMAVQTIALAPKGSKEYQQHDFIAANKEGVTFPNLILSDNKDINKNRVTDSLLNMEISGKLADQLSLINRQNPGDQSGLLQAGMVKNAVQYAKFLATIAGDNLMNNYPDYEDQAVKFIQNSYAVQSNSRAIVAKNQLNLTDNQLDTISFYVHNNFIDNASKIDKATMALDLNATHVTLMPNNDFVVQDSYGKILDRVIFTTDLMTTANRYVENHKKNEDKNTSSGMFPRLPSTFTTDITLRP